MTSKIADNKVLFKAIGVSLFFHLLIATFLLKYKVPSQEADSTEALSQDLVNQSIQVTLFKKHLKQTLPTTPQAPTQTATNTEQQLGTEAQNFSSGDPSTIPVSETQSTEVKPQTLEAIEFTDRLINEAITSVAENLKKSSPQVISAPLIKSQISTYMQNYRTDLTRSLVEECLIYQNQHGVKDCPDNFQESANIGETVVEKLFADITRDSDHQILSSKLERENKQLSALRHNDSFVSQFAKSRYDINLQNIKYLRQEFTYDQPGFSYARLCNPSPCVFKHTEFIIKQPEREPDENAFEIKPTWFNSSR